MQPHKKTQKEKYIQSGGNISPRKYVPVKLNGHSVRLQIDTASDITLISQRLWKTIGQLPVTPTVAGRASGDCVDINGKLPATIENEDKTASGKINRADSRYNVLGLDFIESLGLLDIPRNSVCNAISRSPKQSAIMELTDDLTKRFSPVFTDDLRRCTQAEVTLTLKPSATPIFRPKWPVPYTALLLVDRELRRLRQMKVINPVL